MALDIERIGLVRSASELLAELEWGDVNLIIRGLGLEDIDYQSWNDDPNGRWFVGNEDRQNLLKSHLSDSSTSRLQDAIRAAESILGEAIFTNLSSSVGKPLSIFASHISDEKIVVHEVAKHLASWGVNLFVAHENIEPSTEWQIEIESCLSTCHGAVAFMHPGFHDRVWCNQEMGWIKGRKIPFLMFLFDGQDPLGMLAKTQGQKVSSSTSSHDLARLVMNWAGHHPEFRAPLDDSAIVALGTSKSFEMTDALWSRILKMDNLNETQIIKILNSLSDNFQFYAANCRAVGAGAEFGLPYTKAALKFIHGFKDFEYCSELAKKVASEHGVLEYLESLSIPF